MPLLFFNRTHKETARIHPLRIIFFGSGEFGIPLLNALAIADLQPLLVVTQPDHKKGRHLRLSQTPIKDAAIKHQIDIFQPENLKDEQVSQKLASFNADFFVVVSYGKILPQILLQMPKIMCLNIHASLLPKHRGASPIRYALIKGDKTTGVTFMKMNEHMDQGDILFRFPLRIQKSDDARSLEERLSKLAAGQIARVLIQCAGRCRAIKQKNSCATYAPLIKKKDGCIDWNLSSEEIHRRFRAFAGWPGSFTHCRGQQLKILQMDHSLRLHRSEPGTILRISQEEIEIAAGKGTILFKRVLPEAHRAMSISSFLNGHPLKIGQRLGE